MLVRHILEPLVIMIVFLAVASVAAAIIYFVAGKFNNNEQNQELLDTIGNIQKKAENIADKTGQTVVALDKEVEKRQEAKLLKKKQKREKNQFHF